MPEGRTQFDVVVVGAGFAGVYMLHRLRGLGWSVRVFEAGSGVGGTWYWNKYPGAQCDVQSLDYSYGFDDDLQQEWDWTMRNARQPEILRYINHVADRFDLRGDIQLETRVTAATFDEVDDRWSITTDRGDEVSAQFLVMATGCLSNANVPKLPGLETFEGETYHTGQWPEEGVDFSGKRVAVIGTGSSGIQAIPEIAKEAGHLTVFQRTAAYTLPARNRPLDPEEIAEVKADYPGIRARNRKMFLGVGSRNPMGDGGSALDATPEERQARFERYWNEGGGFLGCYNDLMVNLEANKLAAEFVRSKIREIVEDPEVAQLLMPNTVIGCKRICYDTDYYATYNRPNVSLVDVSKDPIEVVPTGLRVAGTTYEVDAVVFATGYDAMTGSLLAIDIRGRGGMPLKEQWHAGPITYLGLGVPAFPNLFTITGPGSPSVLAGMVTAIEQHVEWISDCLGYLRDNSYRTIEANDDAAHAWVQHVNDVASGTLFFSCSSWYLGANVPGKPRVFMPLIGFPPYVEKCNEVAEKGYDGFTLSR